MAADIHLWVSKLAEELLERLNEDQIKNKRRAHLLTVSMGLEVNKKDIASSKSSELAVYNLDKIVTSAMYALRKACSEDPDTKEWSPPIKYLGLSAGKFANETSNKIMNFFKTNEKSKQVSKEENLSSKEIAVQMKQNESNHSELTTKESILQNGGQKQPSFFEKVLFKGFSKNEGKLNILPDLHKPDVCSENENSRDSCYSEKLTYTDNINLDLPKKVEELPLTINSKKNGIFKSNFQNRKEDSNKTNGKSILSFFSSAMTKEKWIKPEEIFPNLSEVDDDVIEMLPSTFRKKVLELRKVPLKSMEAGNVNTDNVSVLNHCDNNVELVSVNCDENKSGTDINGIHTFNDNKIASDDNLIANTSMMCSSTYIKCSECGENVSIIDKEVHLDLHVAMKLDSELNHKSSLPFVNHKLNTQHKNKRKSKICGSNKVTKKTKRIEAFFRK